MKRQDHSRPDRVFGDLLQWAELHRIDMETALVNAAEAYLTIQGAAGYAEIHEI